MRQLRGNRISLVFQDPMTSLNPVLTIGEHVAEPFKFHQPVSARQAWRLGVEMLKSVGFRAATSAPTTTRTASAAACASASSSLRPGVRPDLIVADEPTTALNVSIQAQILVMLREARQRDGAALVLITHNLGVVADCATAPPVMSPAESSKRRRSISCSARRRHPYTRALLGSLPSLGKREAGACRRSKARRPVSSTCRRVATLHRAARSSSRSAENHTRAHARRGARTPRGPLPRTGGALAGALRQRAGGRLSRMAVTSTVVSARGLTKHFPAGGGIPFVRQPGLVRAVDNVSLDIEQGQSVGLVGESGCGKSTLGRLLLRLIEPTSGHVSFEGTELTALSGGQLRKMRSGMQMVFQDPYASLDPRKRVLDILEEGMLAHGQRDHAANRARLIEILARVGLDERALDRYPHHFSGGQRQRIGIARALAVGARFIVADEPVSALDVSIGAGAEPVGRSARRSAADGPARFARPGRRAPLHRASPGHVPGQDRRGRAERCALRDTPVIRYTRALLECIPTIDPARRGQMRPLAGEIPTPLNPPSGCRFHPRCPLAQPICSEVEPVLEPKADGHLAACHFA